ncbi:hypothetical protein ALC60_14104, partial [Trachymyrmex zeteki]
ARKNSPVLRSSEYVERSTYTIAKRQQILGTIPILKHYIIQKYASRSLLCKLTKQGFTINLIWTPSHKGIVGNDRADQGWAHIIHEICYIVHGIIQV